MTTELVEEAQVGREVANARKYLPKSIFCHMIYTIQGVRLTFLISFSIMIRLSIFVQNSVNMDDSLANISHFVNLNRHFDFCHCKFRNLNIKKHHFSL